MKGYFRREAETRLHFTDDGWLRTGDVGYLHAGELYVVGRIKEIVKKAGAQYDAADMAHTVSNIRGIRAGCVAVFNVEDSAVGTEVIVVVAETFIKDSEDLIRLAAEVRSRIAQIFSTSPDVVRFVEQGTLPKTSSGKVQVSECRRLHQAHELTVLT